MITPLIAPFFLADCLMKNQRDQHPQDGGQDLRSQKHRGQQNEIFGPKVFRLDKKGKDDYLPSAFEDHVKSVKELVAFLSNHEQEEALERTGKRNTNGRDMTISRCTRQSFLIVLESLTSLTNTQTETGHSHLLDVICFESMKTLGVECYFKGMRHGRPQHAYSG